MLGKQLFWSDFLEKTHAQLEESFEWILRPRHWSGFWVQTEPSVKRHFQVIQSWTHATHCSPKSISPCEKSTVFDWKWEDMCQSWKQSKSCGHILWGPQCCVVAIHKMHSAQHTYNQLDKLFHSTGNFLRLQHLGNLELCHKCCAAECWLMTRNNGKSLVSMTFCSLLHHIQRDNPTFHHKHTSMARSNNQDNDKCLRKKSSDKNPNVNHWHSVSRFCLSFCHECHTNTWLSDQNTQVLCGPLSCDCPHLLSDSHCNGGTNLTWWLFGAVLSSMCDSRNCISRLKYGTMLCPKLLCCTIFHLPHVYNLFWHCTEICLKCMIYHNTETHLLPKYFLQQVCLWQSLPQELCC